MKTLQLNGALLSAADFEYSSSARDQALADLAPMEQTAVIAFLREWFNPASEHISAQTSGSTGPPKTILLHKSQLLASAAITAEYFNFEAGQRALLPLSARFIAGKMMLVRAMYAGLHLDLLPAHFQLPVKQGQPPYYAFAVMVPAQLIRVIEQDQLASFAQILLGGADLPAVLRSQLRGVNTPVYQGFGMTETVSHIALRQVNGPHPQKAYTALAGIEIGQDNRQCLRIRGAATAYAWVDSNDVVELRDDRQFLWRGRYDNILNSGGIKVLFEEVEAALSILFATEAELAWLKDRDFAVGRMPDPRFGESVVLWVTGEGPSEHNRVNSLRFMKEKLPLAWAPKTILSITQLPLLDGGKLNRQALTASL